MFKCIRCEKTIPETVKDRRPTDLLNTNFVDGIVEKISIGYGSRHDLKTIVIGICDDCIDNLMEKGIIRDYGDLLDEERRRGGEELRKYLEQLEDFLANSVIPVEGITIRLRLKSGLYEATYEIEEMPEEE
jgi:hypothetical protein